MPRLCTVCTHPRRQDIDMALLLHLASYRRIAAHYGLAQVSLRRHEEHHLVSSLELSKGLTAMLSAENLLEQVGKWHERTEDQYRKADAANSVHVVASVAKVDLAAIDSFARIGPMSEIEQRLKALEQRGGAVSPADSLPKAD